MVLISSMFGRRTTILIKWIITNLSPIVIYFLLINGSIVVFLAAWLALWTMICVRRMGPWITCASEHQTEWSMMHGRLVSRVPNAAQRNQHRKEIPWHAIRTGCALTMAWASERFIVFVILILNVWLGVCACVRASLPVAQFENFGSRLKGKRQFKYG